MGDKIFLGNRTLSRGENPPFLRVQIPKEIEERWGMEEGDTIIFLKDSENQELEIKVI